MSRQLIGGPSIPYPGPFSATAVVLTPVALVCKLLVTCTRNEFATSQPTAITYDADESHTLLSQSLILLQFDDAHVPFSPTLSPSVSSNKRRCCCGSSIFPSGFAQRRYPVAYTCTSYNMEGCRPSMRDHATGTVCTCVFYRREEDVLKAFRFYSRVRRGSMQAEGVACTPTASSTCHPSPAGSARGFEAAWVDSSSWRWHPGQEFASLRRQRV